MYSARLVAILALVACQLCGSSVTAQRTKLPPPTHPDTLPTLIESWSLPASLTGFVKNVYGPRIALHGMLLYVYDHHGRRLAAVKARTGKVVWHTPVTARSDRAFAFTPFVYGGRVYVANDGFLHAFNAGNGKRAWRLAIKGLAINGMARAKHRLFLPWVRAKAHRVQPGIEIWGIDSRNGRVEWNKKYPGNLGWVRGNSDGAYLLNESGVVFGLTPDRGTLKWKTRVKGVVTRPPLLKGNNLFITADVRKERWRGTGVYCVDVKKGKIRWQKKLASKKVSAFLHGTQLMLVDAGGSLRLFDNLDGKETRIAVPFLAHPRTLVAASSGTRAYLFFSDAEGRGFVTLVDLAKKRVLATANSLSMNVRTMLPAAKMVFLDGADGGVYAYRLDRSERPKRRSVPPDEHATYLIERAREGKISSARLAPALAGLGLKAASTIEKALEDKNGDVVQAAASALGLMRARRAVPPLLRTLKRALDSKPTKHGDPVLAIVSALAQIRDGRSVRALAALMKNADQSHVRRRAAYIGLGAIGTPPSLVPIWAFRASKQIDTTSWQPLAHSPTLEYRVERDVSPDKWLEKVRLRTSRTVQTKSGEIFTAALSSYLGGYNDIWIGKSDLSGAMQNPLFTGLTKAESWPKRQIKLKRFKVNEKGGVSLKIEMRRGKGWVSARPVEIAMHKLAKDSDGDKLPDIVERRLRLCLRHSDCDGDGIIDSEDLNPLASSKAKLTRNQKLYREAFFTFFGFLKRRGVVIVDPGKGPSFELYGRQDPIIALRQPAIKKLRKEIGLHGMDFVSFGGPYEVGGEALPDIVLSRKGKQAKLGLDVVRAGNNAVAYNVTLRKFGRNWVVTKMERVWGAE